MLKNIYTLGPSSTSEKIISSLLNSASCFRLNSSHLTENELDTWLKKIEIIFRDQNKEIPVLIDLQGGKMRIGNYPDIKQLPENIVFSFASSSNINSVIPVPHKEFFEALKINDIISLNDLKIKLKVISINNTEHASCPFVETQHSASELEHAKEKLNVEAVVLTNGSLSSNKGINITSHPIGFKDLTTKDKGIIATSMKYRFTCFAFSFLIDGNEADKIRPLIQKRRLIAKIERKEAFDHLNNIDAKFDEIWLCRGDLGAQAGIYNLGELQQKFVDKIPSFKNDCILAGQVLEHMTNFPTPTRSEVVHLYDTEKNGFVGIVLSDETAIGKNPVAVAHFLENIPLGIIN